MNTKLIYRLLFILGMMLSVVACSNDEIEKVDSEETVGPDADGLYHYNLKLNCSIPDNDDNLATRSLVYTWENGESMYFRFNCGDNYVTGKGVYDSSTDSWSIVLSEALPTNQTAQSCEVYYFRDKGSEYDNWIDLNATTAIYYTTNATYICPTTNTIAINASLNRKTWRLRFKGSVGSKIILPAAENSFSTYHAFWYDDTYASFLDTDLSDITLTVNSDGYTPYIYGTFEGSERSKETITVINGSKIYTREISASDLKSGESAYMTIPTSTSFSGWTVENYDATMTIQKKDFVAFNDAIVTQWTVGNTNGTFAYKVVEASEEKKTSTCEILKSIENEENNLLSEVATYHYGEWFLQPDTEYYLFAIAKNASGYRGPVLKYSFTTRATNLPSAEISNVKAATSSKWTFDIALKNGAQAYYLCYSDNANTYKINPHFFAYTAYLLALNNELEAKKLTNGYYMPASKTCDKVTICTWGLDKDGNIGNHDIFKKSVSANSKTKGLSRSNNQLEKSKISSEQMEEMLKHMQVYKIN